MVKPHVKIGDRYEYKGRVGEHYSSKMWLPIEDTINKLMVWCGELVVRVDCVVGK